jgi:prepilin peptidase CpaA
MTFFVFSVAIVGLCLTAVQFDITARRIPNWLVLSTLGAGLAFRATLGSSALLSGVLAAALAFGFGLFFYLLGGLGAGDVKLMAGLAAFLGTEGLLTALAVMAAVGVVMALWATWRRGVLGRTFQNLFLVGMTLGKDTFKGYKGEGTMMTLAKAGGDPVRSPYGVAVAAGALAGWFAPMIGW